MIVFTAPLSYDGDDRLDVSRGGRDPLGVFFAPSQPLLDGYRRLKRAGLGTDAMRAHFARYVTELRASQHPYSLYWAMLREMRHVTLCCYCRVPTMCHRYVLARFLHDEHHACYEGERARE